MNLVHFGCEIAVAKRRHFSLRDAEMAPSGRTHSRDLSSMKITSDNLSSWQCFYASRSRNSYADEPVGAESAQRAWTAAGGEPKDIAHPPRCECLNPEMPPGRVEAAPMEKECSSVDGYRHCCVTLHRPEDSC
jgi:hypothetical protein